MKHPLARARALAVSALSLALVVVGCDSSTSPPGSGGATPSGAGDDASAEFDDGAPTRVKCTGALGHGLSPEHGRLDGQLVSIVPANTRGCPSDADHLHLQVKMNAGVYDISINLQGLEGELDAALPGDAFSEGWHPMQLDYVSDLGIHSPAISLESPGAVRARVEAALATANYISVFGTGYDGSDGAHFVHYNRAGRDGAVVVNPRAPKPHFLVFRFADDTF